MCCQRAGVRFYCGGSGSRAPNNSHCVSLNPAKRMKNKISMGLTNFRLSDATPPPVTNCARKKISAWAWAYPIFYMDRRPLVPLSNTNYPNHFSIIPMLAYCILNSPKTVSVILHLRSSKTPYVLLSPSFSQTNHHPTIPWYSIKYQQKQSAILLFL